MAPPVFKATKNATIKIQLTGTNSISNSPTTPMITRGPSAMKTYFREGIYQFGAPAYA